MTSQYVGTELELFANAVHWKSYALGLLQRHVRGRVLEVGAGFGANTSYLINKEVTRWISLEPDAGLARRIREEATTDSRVEAVCGTTGDLGEEPFDTVLYLDVLEHIEDDRKELSRARGLLNPRGALVVLAPAHPRLYSPFDEAIGHWRRYTRRSLLDAAPAGLVLEESFYLDSAGLFASAANRLLLRHPVPTRQQIQFWDRVLIPASRVLDPLLRRSWGRTVVAVWSRPPASGVSS